MAENFYVNTVGAVPANKLSEAVSLGVTLAEESKAAGSARASVGTIMTGLKNTSPNVLNAVADIIPFWECSVKPILWVH